MPQPVLTIGIATLNRPSYLREAIESIIVSARSVVCPVQLVVSDMGGHSESAHAYIEATRDAPIWLTCEWFSDTTIKTGIDNWERCLSKARGRYYMMIGDDDRLLPDGIHLLKGALDQREPAPAGLLASARDIDATGAHRRTYLNPGRTYEGRAFLSEVITRKLHLRWCAFVALTDELKACRPFAYPFPGGGGAADGAAIVSAALAGNIVSLNVPISEFRVHSGNDSRAISIDYQRTQRQVLEQFVSELPQATAYDRAMVSVWLGTGIYFQCLRWSLNGFLDTATLHSLDELARSHLYKVARVKLSLSVRLFAIGSKAIGAIAHLLTHIGYGRRRTQ
jgi:glycosyltransferase involved in cell wall biosynthesis